MKKRIYAWDNLKFLLIFLVVFGHVLDYYCDDEGIYKGLFVFIYSFHMPAFFFVSGLFSKNTINTGNVAKVLPYLTIYLILEVINMCVLSIVQEIPKNISLLDDKSLPWFMFALFAVHIITMGVKNYKPAYILALSFILSLLSGYFSGNPDYLCWSRILNFYPFFYLGYVMDSQKLLKYVKQIRIRILLYVFLIGEFLVYLYRGENLYFMRQVFTGRHLYEDMEFAYEYAFVLRLEASVLAIITTFALISIIPEGKRLFTWMGKRTLAIYCTHRVAIYFLFDYYHLDDVIRQNYGEQMIWILVGLSVILTFLCGNKLFDLATKKIMSVDWKLTAGT